MAKKLPKKVQEILTETKGQLSALYAHRLKGVILFGSYARGDYTKGSDIDLLMLLDGLEDPVAERERYFTAICDLSLDVSLPEDSPHSECPQGRGADMTESVQELLNKSERSIDAARLLLKDGYPDFAASRAYYAMLYVLQALMLDRNLSYSKHSGIIGAFGKEFVKTGIFDSRFHRYVLSAFDLRNSGDSGGSQDISEKKEALTIAEAVELLGEIKRNLTGGGHE